ncbi:hypothetical protein M0802_011319 [Mischocyttarus mexicanus]|nr:hypothetical protein M0802_011319 [Mischocyttarus mexicanus]
MPPKRRNIGQSTIAAKKKRKERASETSDHRQARNERFRVYNAVGRALETSEQRQARQERNRVHNAHARSLETINTMPSGDTTVVTCANWWPTAGDNTVVTCANWWPTAGDTTVVL